MAAISQTTFFKCIFRNEKFGIVIQIIQVIAWRQMAGNKPLPEAKLTQFTDAYKRH